MILRSKSLIYLTVLLVLLLCTNSFAQTTKGKLSIPIDINTGQFTGATGLPFDVPFNITGTAPSNIKRIEIKYRVKPAEFRSSWMISAGTVWKACEPGYTNTSTAATDQTFAIGAGPLYPNTKYDFNIRIYASPDITADQKTALYKTLTATIDQFVKTTFATDLNALNTELNKELTAGDAPGTKLKNPDGTALVLNVTDADFNPVVTMLMSDYDQIADATTNLSAAVNDFASQSYTDLTGHLKAVSTNPGLLDADGKALWVKEIDPANADYKSEKFADLATLLTDPSYDINTVINGTMKIDGTKLAATDQFSISSMQLLIAFFKKISVPSFKNTAGNDFFSDDQDFVTDAISQSGDIIKYQGIIKSASDDKAAMSSKFPDILKDKLVFTSRKFIDQSTPDVTSQDNAYIGLDYGTAYMFYTSQLFLYEGVNFYFVPVSKDAALSTIHGFWRNMGKRVSIHFGVTQNLVTVQNKRYVPLISGVGSILLGAGVRFSKIMRLNMGVLFFYENDINPVINHPNLTVKPEVSLTFDLNVAKALGGLGTMIGIK